jgi:potassium efflux system protein
MSQVIQVNKGEVIIREGDPSNGFYMLVSGSVEVRKQDCLLETINTPGTIFGEMSQLLKKPRTTTITAIEDTELALVTMGIEQLVVSHPTIAIKLILTLAKRLDTANQRLFEKSNS